MVNLTAALAPVLCLLALLIVMDSFKLLPIRFVGQAMGIDGHRLQHPGLKTPMIVVTRLTPVRL